MLKMNRSKEAAETTYRKFYFSLIVFVGISYSAFADELKVQHEMLSALETDDLVLFEKLLRSGADPTVNIKLSEGSPTNWIGCRAAEKNTSDYVALIAKYGWDLDFRHPEFASSPGYAFTESMLFCSVFALSAESFKYLINAGVDTGYDFCSGCPDLVRQNLLEISVFMNQYDKSAWLLENSNIANSMVSERLISNLVLFQKSVRADDVIWYWKIVDAIRTLGYEISPKMTRPTD